MDGVGRGECATCLNRLYSLFFLYLIIVAHSTGDTAPRLNADISCARLGPQKKIVATGELHGDGSSGLAVSEFCATGFKVFKHKRINFKIFCVKWENIAILQNGFAIRREKCSV